jgi:adenylyltransferase/sulfurtransferase
MLADYDIVVDATDNLLTRYIINDSSVILNKPMVHGAVFNSEGQVSVFNYRGGATYRCYNPYSDQENFMNPLPADSGLFGALTGMTGALMANEVIKIITETGEILSGRMLIFNILTCSFRSLGIKNIPENHLIRTLGEMPGIS